MILGIGFGGSLDGGLTVGVHPNTGARRAQREPWEGCLTLHFLVVDRSRSYSSRIHRAVASWGKEISASLPIVCFGAYTAFLWSRFLIWNLHRVFKGRSLCSRKNGEGHAYLALHFHHSGDHRLEWLIVYMIYEVADFYVLRKKEEEKLPKTYINWLRRYNVQYFELKLQKPYSEKPLCWVHQILPRINWKDSAFLMASHSYLDSHRSVFSLCLLQDSFCEKSYHRQKSCHVNT